VRSNLDVLAKVSSMAVSSALASRRSGVARPSVNQLEMGASNWYASACSPCCSHSRARPIAARSSQDLACWQRAMTEVFCWSTRSTRLWKMTVAQSQNARGMTQRYYGRWRATLRARSQHRAPVRLSMGRSRLSWPPPSPGRHSSLSWGHNMRAFQPPRQEHRPSLHGCQPPPRALYSWTSASSSFRSVCARLSSASNRSRSASSALSSVSTPPR